MYYAVFYLDTTNECIDVNMPQPRQLTGLWNKTDSLSIQSFKKLCFCVASCDFFLFDINIT